MFKPEQVHLGSSLVLTVSLAAHAEKFNGTTTETCAKISVQVAKLTQQLHPQPWRELKPR
jgi:hypothetical protein